MHLRAWFAPLTLLTLALAGSATASTGRKYTVSPHDVFRVAGTQIVCAVVAGSKGNAILCQNGQAPYALVITGGTILVLHGKKGDTLGTSKAVADVNW